MYNTYFIYNEWSSSEHTRYLSVWHLPFHLPVCVCVEEDQETSGDFGSGGAVILLDDQEESPQRGRGRQKERRGRLHPRGAIEDDEDGEDDEIGYVW